MVAKRMHAHADFRCLCAGPLAEDFADADFRRILRHVLKADHPQRHTVARGLDAFEPGLEVAIGGCVGDAITLHLAHDTIAVETVLSLSTAKRSGKDAGLQ